MDIGVLSRSTSFDHLNVYFEDIEKNYNLYSKEELIKFGQYYRNYIFQYCNEFKNQSEAYFSLEEIKKRKDFFSSLFKNQSDDNFLTISIELGNFMQNLKEKYL